MVAVAAAAVGAVIFNSVTSAQAPATSAALKTPWGEPDLQGIWTGESDTPLQRPAQYANQEIFTAAQRAELDAARLAMLSRDRRLRRGSESDVSGAYSTEFLSVKRVGTRTSLLSIRPMAGFAADARRREAAAADREFRLAGACNRPNMQNGRRRAAAKYDAALRGARFPRPNTARYNRHYGPEDASLAERCLTGGLPEFGTAFGGSFRRIVQTPGGIAMFYDVGQEQGWQRNIVMNGSPHLPANIRQWYGDSRGRWEATRW
jgi:hypothetical protein